MITHQYAVNCSGGSSPRMASWRLLWTWCCSCGRGAALSLSAFFGNMGAAVTAASAWPSSTSSSSRSPLSSSPPPVPTWTRASRRERGGGERANQLAPIQINTFDPRTNPWLHYARALARVIYSYIPAPHPSTSSPRASSPHAHGNPPVRVIDMPAPHPSTSPRASSPHAHGNPPPVNPVNPPIPYSESLSH